MTLFHDFVATLTVKPVILLDGSRVMLYAISPEQAQALNVRKAACNNLNRAISASKVTAYRKIISEGNWCPMLDEITYLHVPGHDRHGQLISGQHRLQAIAMGTIIDLWNSFVSNAVMVDTSSTVLLLDPASADIYRQVR